MLSQNIRAKIKKIKIHTKRIMQTTLAGDYVSAFKGSGLEFHQIREYQRGDDVRAIDWNSSAKMNKVMVKQFIEERDRTVIIAIDVSGSGGYGSAQELRHEVSSELAATLAFIAQENKDNVGVLFFTDTIKQWIPPSKSSTNFGRIIENIFTTKPSGGTDITQALRFLISLKKRNAIVFMISDWIDQSRDYSPLLRVMAHEYDFVCMRTLDRCERDLPNVGLLEVIDPETGAHVLLNTSDKTIQAFLHRRLAAQRALFEKNRIDMLDIPLHEPFVQALTKFFHKRIQRQI
jgi:uncharacterized protein (DUF58 family)